MKGYVDLSDGYLVAKLSDLLQELLSVPWKNERS